LKIRDWPWIPFGFFAVGVGLYPLLYYIGGLRHHGLLQSKPASVIGMRAYILLFYIHISFGGVALLIGWTQFSTRLRTRYLTIHRRIGTVYVIAVALSSLAGLFIAFFATGGLVSTMGFGLLALTWLFTDTMAYIAILRRDIGKHEEWMIRNYALCFAAVTLRFYLPLSLDVFHFEFVPAYRVISWLCWVPNLLVAGWIIRQKRILLQSPL